MNKILVTSTLLLSPLLLFAGPPQDGPEGGLPFLFKVGSDAACDYATVPLAMNANPAVNNMVVRVAKNAASQQGVLIARPQLVIEGGYDTCSDTTASGRTTINGTGAAGSVFYLFGGYNGIQYNATLRNLQIRGGVGASSPARGGGLTIEGPLAVNLENTSVSNNSTPARGGGIYIKGQPGTAGASELTRLSLTNNSYVGGNSAAEGGGIACEERVTLSIQNSAVASNEATEAGGGISSARCWLTLNDHLPLQGVILNTVTAALGAGGGIYAFSSRVEIRGGATRKAMLAFNTADLGGGIYLSNASQLYAYDASIAFNTAITGGGVYADGATTVISRTRPGAGCHDETRCSELSDNTSTGLHANPRAAGGALFADGGTTRISGTFIERNRANSSRGMAIEVVDAPGTGGGLNQNGLRILGSVLANNGNGNIEVYPDGSIVAMRNTAGVVGFSTFTGNRSSVNVILTPTTGGIVYGVNVYGSIFDQNQVYAGPGFGGAGAIPSGDCNQFAAIFEPFSMNSLRSTTLSPQFVNSANEDYRLGGLNLVDWCDASFNVLPSLLSADGGPRPHDDPGIGALHGNWDLGGLERHPIDLIFRNGFD